MFAAGTGVAEVEIRTFTDMDLRGGTVIAAFPSVGLVSSITATYLITTMGGDQICALESEDFPSLSMIYARKPKFPARIYALGNRVALCICEVPLPGRAHRPTGKVLLRWAQSHGCRQIVSLEGLPIEEPLKPDESPPVWGVGSTDRARTELDKHGIKQLDAGVIAGVTGILLNEGRWLNYDVIALLAEARPEVPDALSAVSLTQGLDMLLPEIEVDLAPLRERAKELEAHFGRLKHQAKPVVPEPLVEGMYR